MTLEYIKKRTNYFMTESGVPWIPIGYNDSYTWYGFEDRNIQDHFRKLQDNKVNCLRMMFEYAQFPDDLLETKIGEYNNRVMDKWHRIFELCQVHEIRLLVSAYDTFWQWYNWHQHPYNIKNGGYLEKPDSMLSDPGTLEIHKNRFSHLIKNFSETGVIFAWDIWNELEPKYSNNTEEGMQSYVSTISEHISSEEIKLFGKAHLKTCSMCSWIMNDFKHLALEKHVFNNSSLDFCSVHMYEYPTMDDPKNTVEPAISVETHIKRYLPLIKDVKPLLDTESGPAYTYNNLHKVLDQDFDDEYYSNMSWAHLASGGAGIGMRWPYRNPHTLSDGMLQTIDSISSFSKFINWNRFSRDNLSSEIVNSNPRSVKVFASGTSNIYILFLLRIDALNVRGMYNEKSIPVSAQISIPAVTKGLYKITSWKASDKTPSVYLQNSETSMRGGSSLTINAQINRNVILYIEKM